MTARDVVDFVRVLHLVDRGRRPTEVFRDFCLMAFCSIASRSPRKLGEGEAREQRYRAVLDSYDQKSGCEAVFGELLGRTMIAVSGGRRDFLGEVAGEIGSLSSHIGQFMTPYEISKLSAEMMIGDAPRLIEENGYISVLEPALGCGSMVIAVADALEDRGFDPALALWVHATELSATTFHIGYLQLALRGVSGIVVNGNSLSLESFDGAFTPASHLFRLHHGNPVFQQVLKLVA